MRQVLGLQPLVLKVLKSDTKQTQQKDKNSWLCLHLCRRQHGQFQRCCEHRGSIMWAVAGHVLPYFVK